MARRQRSIRSQKHQKKRAKQRWLKWAGNTALFLLFVGGLAVISHHPAWNVQDIAVNGIETIQEDDMVASIRDEIGGSYWLTFSRSNILLLKTNDLEDVLRHEFVRLDTVEVTRASINELQVQVKEREPVGVACPNAVLQTDEISSEAPLNSCYYVDPDGVMYAKAPTFSGDVYFMYLIPENAFGDRVSDEGVESRALGSHVLEAAEFHSVRAFTENLEALNLNPQLYRQLEYGGEVKLAESADTDGFSGTVKFNPEDDISDVSERLAGVIESGILLGEEQPGSYNNPTPDEDLSQYDLSDVAYIDLRFGNKLYYSFVDGESATSQAP